MSHPNYTQLKGFDNVGDSSLSMSIQDGLIEFFDWGLLEKGNFFNVSIPASGQFGGDKHKLRLVDDPNYDSGQVWEGFRSNWVWQSGLSYSEQPLVTNKWHSPGISGVFVDGAFQSTFDSPTYPHSVDYSNGRVIFNTALPTTSAVTAEYSYKWINVVPANSTPWFREIQYGSQRADGHFAQTGSGDWSQLAQSRLQLPAIAVEVVSPRVSEPYQLGGGSYVHTDVIFHVLAEEDYVRDKLIDIVSLQNEKSIYMIDTNRMATNDAFPLDWKGSVKPSGFRYPDLVKPSGIGGYRWKGLRFENVRSQRTAPINESLHTGVVRMTTQVIMGSV
tara:strand:+ start:1408 stop:2403 length:996 start_codon:yes stop_codon:yes gene_type:complete